jgi:predicted CXXCH cytochrome family protein
MSSGTNGTSKTDGAEEPTPPPFLLALLVAAAALAVAAVGRADDRDVDESVYAKAAHGNPVTGVKRRPDLPAGDCLQCHSLHGPRSDASGLGGALFAANDNRLCATCHATPSASGRWPGMSTWEGTAHSRAARVTWSAEGAALHPTSPNGLCLSCHTPHGVADDRGVVPSLTWRRGDRLCFGCHGDRGPARTNVYREMAKASTHSRVTSPSAAPPPASGFGAPRSLPTTVVCFDCHDPHLDDAGRGGSGRSSGLRRFAVSFGSRGSTPTFTALVDAGKDTDSGSGLCLRCHSDQTTGSFRSVASVASELHPQNASFHAVFAPGTDSTIPRESFTGDWTARSRVGCTDCHGSDDSRTKGAHGSRYQPLLVRPYPQTTAERALRPDDLCLACHRASTYLGGTGSDAKAQKASRFNPPATPGGHALHSGLHGISCFACHDAHGSETLPHLLTTSRDGGLTAFKATRDGGECASACHRKSSTSYVRNEGF